MFELVSDFVNTTTSNNKITKENIYVAVSRWPLFRSMIAGVVLFPSKLFQVYKAYTIEYLAMS